MANYLNSDGLSYFYSKLRTKFKPDWLENDNTSTKYISNRTHYQEKTTGQFCDFTATTASSTPTIKISALGTLLSSGYARDAYFLFALNNCYFISYNNVNYPGFYLDEQYTVTINNVSYTDSAWGYWYYNNALYTALGDSRKLSPSYHCPQELIDQNNSDSPYCIVVESKIDSNIQYYENNGYVNTVLFYLDQTKTQYSVQISGPHNESKYLPYKYLRQADGLRGSGLYSSILSIGRFSVNSFVQNNGGFGSSGLFSLSANATNGSHGDYSFAVNNYTVASGHYSSAFGKETLSNHRSQFVFGEYNEFDNSEAESKSKGNYIQIVGNGTSNSARSNAYTLDWSGNGWYSGTVSAGTTQQPASVTNNNDLTTKAYVDNAISSSIEPETDEDVIAMLEQFGLQYEELVEAINASTYTNESVLNSLQS